MNEEQLNSLSNIIIGAAIEVHRNLGPGLLEHAYQSAVMCELRLRGLKVDSEVEIPLVYKGIKVDVAYRANLIVENEIILELKATENDNPLYSKQLLTYLKIADKKLGMIINFNRWRVKDGIKRIVNNL